MKRADADRRRLVLGGTALLACASLPAVAQAATDYAVFTEFSPATKPMKKGWNRRIFTDADVRKGTAIQCDFATGLVSLAPGTYRLSGMSLVTYYTGQEPPETTTIRAPTAAAGYCRLRTFDANRQVDPENLTALANGDPSVICVGSPASANMAPSTFEAFFETERPVQILLEHQAGNDPQQIYLRIFVQNSKWHAFARLAIQRL